MKHQCQEIPVEELLRAVEQFNRREWFDCHETLEELWLGESGVLRNFYQGFLQLAVALHHWRNGNYKGSILLLQKGGRLLRHVPTPCQGIDVGALVAAADRLLAELSSLGEERMQALDPLLIPRIAI